MGCKCISTNEEVNGEISKENNDDNIYEIYQENNLNEPDNSNENYDENDIINNLIKNDINYENENNINENTKYSRNSKYSNYAEIIIELINNIHTDKYEELEQKVKVIKTNIILVNKNNIVKEKKDI